MAYILVKLNECRLETRNGLAVKTRVIPPTPGATQLKENDRFRLVIWVQNTLEAGAGGPAHGDAHFKNITCRVTGTHHADLLESQNGSPVAGNKKTYPIPLGPDNTLAEGEKRALAVWFEAKGPCDEVEHLADLRVRAEFDIARYFTSAWPLSVHFDIVDS